VYWAHYADGARINGPAVDRPDDVPTAGVAAVAGAAAELYPSAWAGLRRLDPAYPAPAALVRIAADRLAAGAPSERLTPRYLRHPDAVVPGAPKAVSR
jgi:tRNA A37 threonylcarbamoyladenosine modification protein TsaB